MADDPADPIAALFSMRFQAHPWHGVPPRPAGGRDGFFNAYVEIVPSDEMKYELDKPSGQLRLDRPQRYSSLCPTMYGFVPRTWCGPRVGARCDERTGRKGTQGDGDPIDICILAERPSEHGGFLTHVRPIGGLRMIDGTSADDKLVAVLESDATFGGITDLADVPRALYERIEHYFLTYKQRPNAPDRAVAIPESYGREEALHMIDLAEADYVEKYGDPDAWGRALAGLLRGGAGKS